MWGANDNISALSSSQSQSVAIKTDSWLAAIPRERQRHVRIRTQLWDFPSTSSMEILPALPWKAFHKEISHKWTLDQWYWLSLTCCTSDMKGGPDVAAGGQLTQLRWGVPVWSLKRISWAQYVGIYIVLILLSIAFKRNNRICYC